MSAEPIVDEQIATEIVEETLSSIANDAEKQAEQNNDLLTALPDEQNQPDAK